MSELSYTVVVNAIRPVTTAESVDAGRAFAGTIDVASVGSGTVSFVSVEETSSASLEVPAAVAAPVVTGGTAEADVDWTDSTEDDIVGYIVTLSNDTPAIIASAFVAPEVETVNFPGLVADDYTATVTAVRGVLGTASAAAAEDAVA